MLFLSHFSHDLGISYYSPLRVSFLQETGFEHPGEVSDYFLSVLLQVVFSSYQSDAAEDLHSQVLTSYGSDDIDSVLLFLDEVSPHTEDVSSLVYVGVVVNSADMSFKSFLIISLQLFFEIDGFIQLYLQLHHFLALLSLFLLLLPLEVSPLLFLSI